MLESDDRVALQCGHVYHQSCIGTYADVQKVHIADLRCPKCKATSHDIRAKEEAAIIHMCNVYEGPNSTDAVDLTATEATRNDQDTGDAAAVAATEATQTDQAMGDAAAGALAATEAAQPDQDMGEGP